MLNDRFGLRQSRTVLRNVAWINFMPKACISCFSQISSKGLPQKIITTSLFSRLRRSLYSEQRDREIGGKNGVLANAPKIVTGLEKYTDRKFYTRMTDCCQNYHQPTEWFLGKYGIEKDFSISPWSTSTSLKENISKSPQLLTNCLHYCVS